jgi:hypothetical protein
MCALRVTLYVAGAVLELGGILLVGWPDVLPYGERASRWLRLTAERIGRRTLGRPRAYAMHAEAGSVIATGASISGTVSVDPGASLEDRVNYLLRRDKAAQEKLGALDKRLRRMEEHVPKRFDELRAETEQHVADEINAAEWRYRPLRFVGALALGLGLALTTIANFL